MSAPTIPQVPPLARAVTTLWGVGGERAGQLARLEIATIEDLLLHRPRRYEDRRHFGPIAELIVDEPATTRGTVVALGVKRFRHGQKSVFELILTTARGACIAAGGICRSWRNTSPWVKKWWCLASRSH